MHIVIIGNGVSGITAARHIRKRSDHQVTVISAESEHFFSRTALMYVYMGHMRWPDIKPYEDWFWEKNRIDLVHDRVESIAYDENQVILAKASPITYDKLILATGSKSNKFGWPGQDLEAVYGLYSKQDLEAMERFTPGLQRAVIVGGGLIGIEMAEMFRSRKIAVTMLVREHDYWNNVLPPEEAAMISRHIREHHIDLRLGVNLGEVIDDGQGKACAVIIKETGERIDCGYVGLTAGVSPQTDLVKDGPIETNRGILVDDYLETSVPGIYALGDCAEVRQPQPGRRSIEAIWYAGRMMGETVAHTLTGDRQPYRPRLWFNSAKFLDIEYQVYGNVTAALPEDLHSLYWEHKDGRRSIRINYDRSTEAVVGFNLFGIRYRHEVCEKWILDKTELSQVLQDISLANFDPEFCKQYEQDLVDLYNQATGKNLSLRKKRSLDQVLSFLTLRS